MSELLTWFSAVASVASAVLSGAALVTVLQLKRVHQETKRIRDDIEGGNQQDVTEGDI